MRRLQCLPLSWTELLHPKLSWTQTPPLHHTSFTAMAAAPTSLSLRFVFCTSSPSIDHMDHSGFSSKVLLLADTDTWHWYVTLIRRLIFRTVAATWCKSQGKSCSTKWRSVTTCALSSRTRERELGRDRVVDPTRRRQVMQQSLVEPCYEFYYPR